MSGVCTGWVGLHGPHPDDVDQDGKKYGARARGMRLVLLAVADSANVDGEHSHPGIANVARFSLYSAGQCRRTLDLLEAEGWLIVTEQGGGRATGSTGATPKGRATVYRVPMDPASHPVLLRRASRAGIDSDNARTAGGDTRAPAPLTRAPRSSTRAPGRAPNGVPNGPSNEPTNDEPSPPAPPPPDPAKVIAKAVWEASNPRPAQPFIAVVKIAQRLLDAGHAADAIEAAMLDVPTISTRWVEAKLNERRRSTRRGPVAPTEDRSAPSGRIDL